MTKETLVEVKDLKTYFNIEGTWAKAVDGVTFNIYKGEVLGLVGVRIRQVGNGTLANEAHSGSAGTHHGR